MKLRLSIKNCRVTFIDFYSVFPTNFRIVFLPHTNSVILLKSYCGTITEPALPVANFLAGWEATQQRPSSHKSECLLHVNGLYFYTNTAFRAHQVSESDTETTSFLNASEWFMAASTLIQIEKYAVSKMSGFVWSRSKF